MSTRLHIVMPDEMMERIDRLRGDVPRAAWIRRAIETLADRYCEAPSSSAPSRTPGKVTADELARRTPPPSKPKLPPGSTKPYELPKYAARKPR